VIILLFGLGWLLFLYGLQNAGLNLARAHGVDELHWN
jgi:hypothetical protein